MTLSFKVGHSRPRLYHKLKANMISGVCVEYKMLAYEKLYRKHVNPMFESHLADICEKKIPTE